MNKWPVLLKHHLNTNFEVIRCQAEIFCWTIYVNLKEPPTFCSLELLSYLKTSQQSDKASCKCGREKQPSFSVCTLSHFTPTLQLLLLLTLLIHRFYYNSLYYYDWELQLSRLQGFKGKDRKIWWCVQGISISHLMAPSSALAAYDGWGWVPKEQFVKCWVLFSMKNKTQQLLRMSWNEKYNIFIQYITWASVHTLNLLVHVVVVLWGTVLDISCRGHLCTLLSLRCRWIRCDLMCWKNTWNSPGLWGHWGLRPAVLLKSQRNCSSICAKMQLQQ